MDGYLNYAGAGGLLQSARDGRPAFEHVHGAPFFDHHVRDHARELAFQASMAGRAELEAAAVVAAFDFRPFRRLVDVGGGQGIRVRAARGGGVRGSSRVPRRRHLRLGPGRRRRLPPLAVLHDWDDADAARILATCRAAMTPASRLLVVEALLPEFVHDAPPVIRMDIHMLELLGARERTEAEYRELLAGAGFDAVRVVSTSSEAGLSAGLSVIEAAPTRP